MISTRQYGIWCGKLYFILGYNHLEARHDWAVRQFKRQTPVEIYNDLVRELAKHL